MIRPRTPRRGVTRALALLVAVALAGAACGDDDDPELSTEVPTSTPAVDAAQPTPTAADPAAGADDGAAGDGSGADDPGDADDAGDEGADGTTDDAEPDEQPTPGGGEAVPTPTQAPTSGEPAFTAASKLTTVGLDEIFFGDPVDFAAEQAGTTWIGLPEAGTSPECYTVQPSGGPAGVIFTVFAGRIERVDITNPLITTRSGAGVGSTPAGLAELFGERLETTDLDGGGADIMFVPTDADDREFRIIWRTDGVATVSMRAGRVPVVLPDAPCG